MKIGVAQMNTCAGDFARTADRMVEYSRQAADQGVDLLAFPMATLTGPVPVAAPDQEGFLLDLSVTLDDLASRLKCTCLVPVVAELDYDTVCETMLIKEGQVLPLRLSAYFASQVGALAGVDSDEEGSQNGSQETVEADGTEGVGTPTLPCFDLDGTRFGVAVNYDDLDDFVDYDLDIDVLIYIDSYGFSFDEPNSALGAALGENRFVDDAQNMDAWIVGVGSLGGYGPFVFPGSSFAVAPWGQLEASAPSFEEALMVAQVEPESEGPLAHPLTPEVYNRALFLWESLRLGLHDYLWKAGLTDAVLMLDGKVGSSVLAALACDALGPLHVHVLVPDYLDQTQRASALQLVRRLRMECRDLGEGKAASGVSSDKDPILMRDMAMAQTAAFARELGALLLGPQDKTYLCLEADQAKPVMAGMLPLGDVYRSEVLELARLRNTISPVIPEDSERAFDLPQLDVQTGDAANDELLLAQMDAILAAHIEWEYGLTDAVSRQGNPVLTQGVIQRFNQCELGRTGCRTMCLAASTNTVFDARVPMGLRWEDHVRGKDERVSEEDIIRHLRKVQAQLEHVQQEGQPNKGEEVHDVIDLLRDFVQGGSRPSDEPNHGRGGGPGMPGGSPMSWGGPFSEN
ncbi:MAG: nitrilase-related carbon-nitrogen hydrolase [Atopobiaceae bacterium]